MSKTVFGYSVGTGKTMQRHPKKRVVVKRDTPPASKTYSVSASELAQRPTKSIKIEIDEKKLKSED